MRGEIAADRAVGQREDMVVINGPAFAAIETLVIDKCAVDRREGALPPVLHPCSARSAATEAIIPDHTIAQGQLGPVFKSSPVVPIIPGKISVANGHPRNRARVIEDTKDAEGRRVRLLAALDGQQVSTRSKD